MEYSNAAIVFVVVSVVLAVLGLAFAGLYCLNKTVDDSAP
jgi:hypothetical protein